ncbi:two component transcriptional regulator, LuxR family [Mucilaginibacter pineti]|uniref:Two component transcriptional regulator, LuxR family n=1 Tax=Mucilaginibacter pineti TaxID=1391627 RepID=A0A1G7H6W6_9SPHI|nr:response regulator transcription factor [Mucilaginibacter pineti]SDE96004.1 two component transcriptional regulator, LuxR family [Mucilaginibacter pineti]
MIQIILAEDHNIVRNGIRSLFEKEKDFEITGEALNGREVLDLLKKGITAHIVLADMNMPELSGIELIAKLRDVAPGCRTIVLSALDHEKYVVQAFQTGASGYLLKSASADELIFAIKHVFAGSQYICSELTTRFLNRLLTIPDPVNTELVDGIELSSREVEILGLVADGFTNQEIADKIFTSKRTIEGHRQALIDKTGSRNTAALIRFALVNGIIG